MRVMHDAYIRCLFWGNNVAATRVVGQLFESCSVLYYSEVEIHNIMLLC